MALACAGGALNAHVFPFHQGLGEGHDWVRSAVPDVVLVAWIERPAERLLAYPPVVYRKRDWVVLVFDIDLVFLDSRLASSARTSRRICRGLSMTNLPS